MSLLNEYISKGIDIKILEDELLKLIKEYNKERSTYLFVYISAINKRIPDIPICQEDYYVIADLLRNKTIKKLDFYIETPGGSGEAAEEIVRFLRQKSDDITFVVSGEAKSAGTLMVLSGNEIMMTQTGSLGPIDAQIRIGRSFISAMDYKEWFENKITEAKQNNVLNPVDATIIAQISPGEIKSVYQSLDFAKDLVTEWLPKYKFKDWKFT
ncbi:ATP-dependent Clp protease proteolytic subunit, partial [candidate division WOR-3 bacterium]|nr:ATP-dependent Clp protease proteolytic subunit [candidate division WOR-3 bacterium]